MGKEKNKVEIKKFLGMEVRLVNDEYRHDKATYIINFKDGNHKVGASYNIKNRIKVYYPYNRFINSIFIFKNNNPFEIEKEILKNNTNEIIFGKEWFSGIMDLNYFTETCCELHNKYESEEYDMKHEYIKEKHNDESIDQDSIDCTLKMLYGIDRKNVKINKLSEILNIMKLTMDYTMSKDNNIYKFISLYNESTHGIKYIISDNIFHGKKIYLKNIVESIDILMRSKSPIGIFLFIDNITKNFSSDQREFIFYKFVRAFEFTGSHKTSGEMALKLARKKFNIEEDANEKAV